LEGRLSVQDLWDRIWRDENGKIVIWQRPNLWLIGWAVLTTISLFISGRGADIFSWLAEISLIIWSLLEITKGANYFRRVLGLLVLIFAVMSLIKNF
jgi:hypothetical protein